MRTVVEFTLHCALLLWNLTRIRWTSVSQFVLRVWQLHWRRSHVVLQLDLALMRIQLWTLLLIPTSISFETVLYVWMWWSVRDHIMSHWRLIKMTVVKSVMNIEWWGWFIRSVKSLIVFDLLQVRMTVSMWFALTNVTALKRNWVNWVDTEAVENVRKMYVNMWVYESTLFWRDWLFDMISFLIAVMCSLCCLVTFSRLLILSHDSLVTCWCFLSCNVTSTERMVI